MDSTLTKMTPGTPYRCHDPEYGPVRSPLLHHVLYRARKRPITVNGLPAVNCVFSVGLTGFEPATP